MPLAIFADERMPVPRDTFMILTCAGCRSHSFVAGGPQGYIAMRAASYAEGWRRRNNEWWAAQCVPKGNDNAET